MHVLNAMIVPSTIDTIKLIIWNNSDVGIDNRIAPHFTMEAINPEKKRMYPRYEITICNTFFMLQIYEIISSLAISVRNERK